MKIFYLVFLYTVSSKNIDPLHVLDAISNAMDFFLFNFEHWDGDLIWSFDLIQIQSQRILDKYIRSLVDFDSSYIPILRRLYSQSLVMKKKITNLKTYLNYNEKQYDYLIERFKNESFFDHTLTDKDFVWRNNQQSDKTLPQLSHKEYLQCLLQKFEYKCDSKFIGKDSVRFNCHNLIKHIPTTFDIPDETFKIIYVQLRYTLMVHRTGCLNSIPIKLNKLREWQAELCANAMDLTKKLRKMDPLILFDTETICLFLGFMDFLSRGRFDQMLSLHVNSAKATYNLMNDLPIESQGCFVSSQLSSQNVRYRLSASLAQQYIPFSHPFSQDFDTRENALLNAMNGGNAGMQPPEILSQQLKRKGRDGLDNLKSGTSDTLCDAAMTNVAIRFLMIYTTYLLDPGPQALASYRLDPDTYEVNNVSIEGFISTTSKKEITLLNQDRYTNLALPGAIYKNPSLPRNLAGDDDIFEYSRFGFLTSHQELAFVIVLLLILYLIYHFKLRCCSAPSKRFLNLRRWKISLWIKLSWHSFTGICHKIFVKTIPRTTDQVTKRLIPNKHRY